MNNIIKLKNREQLCGQCCDCKRINGVHETEDDLFYNCEIKGLINIETGILKCKYFKRNHKYITSKGLAKKFETYYTNKVSGVKLTSIFNYKHGKWKWRISRDK